MSTRSYPAHFSLWYHGWDVVGLRVLVQIPALGLTLNSFSLFLHEWMKEFGLPVRSFALGITVFSAGCTLVAPFSGRGFNIFLRAAISG
jgi:hypothetical protein